MAKQFNCSKSVLYKSLRREGIALKDRYSEITEEELSATISAIKASFPNAGSQVCNVNFHNPIDVHSLYLV